MIPRRTLGRTGLDVSILGLGGHVFPSGPPTYYPGPYGRRFREEEAYDLRRSLVETAVAAGVNLLAADFDYEARALGRIVLELGVREKVLVTSVIDWRAAPGEKPDWAKLDRAVLDRLDDLGFERIDLPQIRVTNACRQGGFLDLLAERLDRLGSRGWIGPAVFYSPDLEPDVLTHGLESGRFPAVLRPYGWLRPQAGTDVLPAAAKVRAGFIGMVPFQKGWLFDCGREAELAPDQTAALGLNWALGREGVTSVLCGAASVIELAANLKAARETIPLAQAETGLAPCRSTEAFRRFEAEMMKAGLNPPDWGGV